MDGTSNKRKGSAFDLSVHWMTCYVNLTCTLFIGLSSILADDMGLGKTLQSVCLIYTLLKTGITANREPTAKRVIVVCPCSLVKNWENEFVKWLGPGVVKTLALAEADRKTVEKNIDIFVRTKMFNVLIASYECIRTHVGRLKKYADCCDLLVCDEAHRLKNSENQTSRALNSLPVKRRVLLTGTPMQNDLQVSVCDSAVDDTCHLAPLSFIVCLAGVLRHGRLYESRYSRYAGRVSSQDALPHSTWPRARCLRRPKTKDDGDSK
jgi:SNF2-related domain